MIAALGADGKTNLIGTGSYGQELAVTLVVSAGAVPDVANQTFAQASTILAAVKLTAQEGDHAQQRHGPAGKVIALEVPDGTFLHPGDTVKLQISDGPGRGRRARDRRLELGEGEADCWMRQGSSTPTITAPTGRSPPSSS